MHELIATAIIVRSAGVIFSRYLVRLTGLEPARLAAPEPKSGVSANFTTGALRRTIIANSEEK